MSAVKAVLEDAMFQTELSSAGAKLVVVDFTATWCGPCKRIAPFFDELSTKYEKAVFLKVDVDQCQETAAANGVSAMPTFIFFRNKTKIDKIQGADNKALEEKVVVEENNVGSVIKTICRSSNIMEKTVEMVKKLESKE